jgi:ketosteroid isomerase-like protein
MKIRSVVALLALAISMALPAIAETNTPDPQLREKLIAVIKKHTDALDKNDAVAVAANFTEDAVSVEQDGPAFGREAIEKLWADRFQKVHFSNNIVVVDEDSPHIVGTDGKQMWATGRWSATIQGKDWSPKDIKGYWSVIREGDDWKIRMLTSKRNSRTGEIDLIKTRVGHSGAFDLTNFNRKRIEMGRCSPGPGKQRYLAPCGGALESPGRR